MDNKPTSHRPTPWYVVNAKSNVESRQKEQQRIPPRVFPVAADPPIVAETLPFRLCVLEDSYSNLRVMLRMFHERGFQADHFTNFDAALAAIAQGEYRALIVSDSMAGGAEACQIAITRVRGHMDAATAATPILAITQGDNGSRCRVLEVLGATQALSELTDELLTTALATLMDKNAIRATVPAAAEPRVLLLEDSYNLSLMLVHVMTQAKHVVDHVTTSDQALGALKQHHYEIVIVSQDDGARHTLCLPFIASVGQIYVPPAVAPRVWVLTNNLTIANLKVMRQAGVEQVLPKRDTEQLEHDLQQLLEGKQPTPLRKDNPSAGVEPKASSTESTEAQARGDAIAVDKQVLPKKSWSLVAYFVAALLLSGGGGWAWLTYFDAATVKAETVRRGVIERTFTVKGKVVSKHQVNLPSAQTGQLLQVFVNEGDLVRKGEALATLDNREATINVRRAEAQVFRYRTERNLADKTLLSLSETSPAEVAGGAVAEAKAERAMAHAKLRVAEQDLRSVQLILDRLVIAAPFSGVISRSSAVEGKWVEAGEPVFTLVDFDALEIALPLPRDYASDVITDAPVYVSVDDQATDEWRARIARLVTDPVGNADMFAQSPIPTAAFATWGPDAPELKMDQRVSARIVIDTAADALIVPEEALRTMNGKHFVAVIEDDRVLMRAVQPGLQHNGEVALITGVTEQERIAISTVPLVNGQRVVVSDAPETANLGD